MRTCVILIATAAFVFFAYVYTRRDLSKPPLPSMAPPIEKSPKSLNEIQTWGYQLQGTKGEPLKLDDLKRIPVDLLVTDHSRTGAERDEFSRDDIMALKRTGKIVLSYLSIGEAEEVRFYFKKLNRKLIEKENPAWKGNHKAYYWEPEWKAIIFEYLDRIIEKDFDGVYLDIVDAYEYFGFKENGGNGVRERSALDMIEFVKEIAHHAREKRARKDFIIFVQNAPAIVSPDALPQGVRSDPEKIRYWEGLYMDSIQGIGVEDLFFYGERPNNNPYNLQHLTLAYLEIFKKHQKKILSIEYIQNSVSIERYFEEAKRLGFIPLAVERSLDGRFLSVPQRPLPSP